MWGTYHNVSKCAGVIRVVVLAMMFVVGKKKGNKGCRTRAQKGQRGDGVRVAGARGGG